MNILILIAAASLPLTVHDDFCEEYGSPVRLRGMTHISCTEPSEKCIPTPEIVEVEAPCPAPEPERGQTLELNLKIGGKLKTWKIRVPVDPDVKRAEEKHYVLSGEIKENE